MTSTKKKYSENFEKWHLPTSVRTEIPIANMLGGILHFEYIHNLSLSMILWAFFILQPFSIKKLCFPLGTYLFITPADELKLIKICLPTMSDIILCDNCFLCVTTILLLK